MKTKTNPAAIGIFIAGAIIILFASVIIFGSGRFFHKTKQLLLTFREPVTGLDVGAPVKLVGVTIGSVKEIHIGVGEETNNLILINVVVEIDLQGAQASFGDYKIDLEDRKRFERMTKELGLRGQIDVLSMLSGQLYIALDMYPGQEGFQLDREEKNAMWEIPTLPSTKQKMMQSLVTSLENFTKFDVKGTSDRLQGLLGDLRGDLAAMQLGRIGTNLDDTVVELKGLLGDPALRSAITNLDLTLAQLNQLGGTLNLRADPILLAAETDLKKAEAMIDEAGKTLRVLQAELGPDSTLSRELVRALDEASTTLIAFRQLVQEIERNPSSLITGKKETTP